jgi:hypothetical protein
VLDILDAGRFRTSLSMRRWAVVLLFPLLLIAQQGAFVHSLQHLPGGAATSKTQNDVHPADDQYCQKCFAFAQIGAAANSSTATPLVVAEAFQAIGFRLPIAPLPQAEAPRNRGPPSPL